MIKSLYISNYALIDELKENFDKGLTIITGETGSGKSIILGALGLIMGQRADTTVIADVDKKCVVEAIFDVTDYKLDDLFGELDVDYFKHTIIRREILPGGRSRAFVNDTPVTLSALKTLTSELIDIHSQHDTLKLNAFDFQIQTLDIFAGNISLLEDYQKKYDLFLRHKQDLIKMEEKAQKEKTDAEYYEFQYKRLEEASLYDGEQEELEEELKKLQHIEEIKENLAKIKQLLDNEDFSVISLLNEARNSADKISGFLSSASDYSDRIYSVLVDLQDLANEVEFVNNKMEFEPGRLEYVSSRLNLIYELQHKFSVHTISQLIDLKEQFLYKLEAISSYDDKINSLKIEIDRLERKLSELAGRLHASRMAVVDKFSTEITKLLADLGMPSAVFKVKIDHIEDFSVYGTDRVEFLFSANKNVAPKPINKVASGGELSRLMLALKYVVSQSKTLPTIIFDEIDTGISGEVAEKTGRLLRRMAEKMQIINITHLPQVAAKGHSHLLVYKTEENGKTVTKIRRLSDDERLLELAKMISGENVTDSAIDTAKSLLLTE